MIKKDLICLQYLTPKDARDLIKLAHRLKSGAEKGAGRLKGKTIALIFQKPSNRTRVSFEVGMYQLGGNCLYLGPEEINLGKRESTADVAKTLSRYLDGIVARTFSHDDVEDLGQYASIPVINGLSDLGHPCQALADLMTVQEKFRSLKGLTFAYIGDGNNVCHSLMIGCAMLGMHMHVGTPKGYEPLKEIVEIAQTFADKSGAKIRLFHQPEDAARKANVLYTDVWTSMGQEEEAEARVRIFKGFQINQMLAEVADKDYIFMHCLPAHRGQEVTEDIIDGPHSVVFDQAENRLHAQKAVLLTLLGGKKI